MHRINLPAFRIVPFFILLLTFAATGTFAQPSRHANIWYFGAGAGIDFSSGQPLKLSGINVDSYEGCAIYCDADGKVLLYTNGGGIPGNATTGQHDGIIWNRDQQVMFDMGDTQGGGYSAAQSSVIVPDPGDTNRYYVFTMDHNPTPAAQNRGLSCFVVDMSLDGGLGGVAQANIPVYQPATECLAAVAIDKGAQGHWIVTVDRDSKDFVLVPLTAAGIGTPVVQPRAGQSDVLVIKASPLANSLCVDGEIYDFNAAAGTLSLREQVTSSGYTFSYSPNGRYLYALESDATGTLIRYNLEAADIAASVEVLTFDNETPVAGHMQIGPDGNIYWIEQLADDFLNFPPTVSLSVVRCPDGASPEVERSIMKFETNPDNAGGFFTSLPNFSDWIFASEVDSATLVTPTVQDTCAAIPFTLRVNAPVGANYLWTDGSTADTLLVEDFGNYAVTVTTACGTTTLSYSLPEPVGGCCRPFTPNAFTPNNDGVNDRFSPVLKGCDVEYLEFNVYSRWGELMYQGFLPGDRWDGTTLNGTDAPSDIYVYTARYKLADEAEEKTQKGDVALLR